MKQSLQVSKTDRLNTIDVNGTRSLNSLPKIIPEES